MSANNFYRHFIVKKLLLKLKKIQFLKSYKSFYETFFRKKKKKNIYCYT